MTGFRKKCDYPSFVLTSKESTPDTSSRQNTNGKGRMFSKYHLNESTSSVNADMVRERVLCFCRCEATLGTHQIENNLGRLYFACGQEKKCTFFQWADRIQPKARTDAKNRHPSYDVGKLKYKRDDIEIVDRTNEIVYPPELRGLVYTPELAEKWRQGTFKRH